MRDPIDIIERSRKLLLFVTQHLLVGYQVAVLILTSVFLLVVAILYFIFNGLILGQ